MRNRAKMTMVLCAAALAMSAMACGCGRRGRPEDKDAIAYVNKDPVYRSDLAKGIALRAKLDPSLEISRETEQEQLDLMINKKLIIQEAMEKGLAREDRFVNTIKAFWEQTLIRDFVDYKKSEFRGSLYATDADVKKYYANLSENVTFRVSRADNKTEIDNAYKRYLETKDASLWQAAGPLRYDDIASGVLLDAFEMPAGEARVFEAYPYWYLIEVSERTKVALEPLEALRPEIEKRVITLKERRLFEEWLKEKRKRSDIRILK